MSAVKTQQNAKSQPAATAIRGQRRSRLSGWPAPGSLAAPAERASYGKSVRTLVPREEHAALDLPADRRDPIDLLESQAATRLPDLVPVRYGRMSASPFAYFRGAALPMASDLAGTPVTGLSVQACGDAHLSNFGLFGTPERRLVFDVNDFDETLPGPWEWDVKRLAASIEIAARDKQIASRQRRKIVLGAVMRYREAMRAFAGQTNLDVWYASLDVDALQAQVKMTARMRRAVDAGMAKARSSDSLRALSKLTREVNGRPQIISDPPLMIPMRDFTPREEEAEGLLGMLRELLASYRKTLPADIGELLARYELADIARKVVGVGSVGSRCWIVLLLAADGSDPLFLQVKEAERSVLEDFTEHSKLSNHGERVVHGQRYMQAASDIFLGWIRVARGIDDRQHDYYVRQLRDWKFSFDVAGMPADWLQQYASYCGWGLARAHAKTGDRFALAAYLGSSGVFDEAVADFAAGYADQNERDYAALLEAIRSRRLPCEAGV
ncbi:MAG TPA: DUF2252 domain-containing protein [Streptosporangiaceae bacterium]|nr:DUF2252 domain-containing protein [Streptosporangiaceae bacterium]